MAKIVIIGGGASGITAAITAARNGAEVTVLERENKPLKKLAVTGNGKCNLSNLSIEEDSFRSSQPQTARRIADRFGMAETFSFFERMGILIIQKGENRVYPACESAAQVCRLMLAEAKNLGVKIKNTEEVKTVVKNDDGTFKVVTDTWHYPADKVILACGTNASIETDKEVLAEKLAPKFGLKTHTYLPALTKLYGSGSYMKKWAGVRTFAVIRMYCNDEYVTETYGEIQLTESGISGIPVFELSRYVNIMISRGYEIQMEIDFFPDCDEESLSNVIRKTIGNAGYKTVRMAFLGILPEKLIDAIVTDEMDRAEAVRTVKQFRFPVASLSKISESQVCSGGIDLTEVTEDLELKKVPGFFVTGEALDVDGACGGYNLQWAWSTGALAGRKASQTE